jgi:hypothetical protein
MATKINNSVLNLLKQYLPTTQADNTRLGTQKSNATAADVRNMDYLRTLGIQKDKAERESLDNARRTISDKSIPYQFPNGKSKTWDKMTQDEKDYIQGQSLRTKGRIFETGKEGIIDKYLNPLNMLGNMAANAAESNYAAKETGSAMPYLEAYGLPLVMGRAMGSGTMNPLSKAFYTNEVSNPEFINQLSMGLAGKRKPNVSSVVENNGEKRGLFDYNRAKVVRDYNEKMKMNEALSQVIKQDPTVSPTLRDFGEKLAQDVKEDKRIISLQNPKYEIIDPKVHGIMRDIFGRVQSMSQPERVLNFMSDDVRHELENPSAYGRTNRHRLPGFLRNNDSEFANIKLIEDYKNPAMYYSTNGFNTIGINPRILNTLLNSGEEGLTALQKGLEHETQHHFQEVLHPKGIDPIAKKLSKLQLMSPEEIIKTYGYLMPKEDVVRLLEARQYFEDPTEKTPMLSEVRSDLLNKKILSSPYKEVNPDMLAHLDDLNRLNRTSEKTDLMDLLKNNRVLPFVKSNSSNYKLMSKELNKLLGLTGVGVGTNALIKAANKKQNQ